MDNRSIAGETPSDDVVVQRDEMLRRALATPPISNEDILKRSKESSQSK